VPCLLTLGCTCEVVEIKVQVLGRKVYIHSGIISVYGISFNFLMSLELLYCESSLFSSWGSDAIVMCAPNALFQLLVTYFELF
jgi:hypothetical protein